MALPPIIQTGFKDRDSLRLALCFSAQCAPYLLGLDWQIQIINGTDRSTERIVRAIEIHTLEFASPRNPRGVIYHVDRFFSFC